VNEVADFRGQRTGAVSAYAIDAGTGKLAPAGHVPSGGRTPRHFAIDPSGRWLLAANQNSNSIAVCRLDGATGRPIPLGRAIEVSKPVCVLFVPVPPRAGASAAP